MKAADKRTNDKDSADRRTPPANREIAARLEQLAEFLDARYANPYRVRAYRIAATTLRELDRPVMEIWQREGMEGLQRLPGVGISIARSIQQLLTTGRLNLLEQLRSETSPEQILATVPGIGPKLARRIHNELGIESLADLERSAYDGRLAQVPGFGMGRLRAVRESLSGRLHRRPQAALTPRTRPTADQPAVGELLAIDRHYREKARGRELPRIAPRRFNPTREAWLPVLHMESGDVHYTALFSNTARAHELGMIHDWVIIYRDAPQGKEQWTVVTARYGALCERRIVRGREAECLAFYRGRNKAQTGRCKSRAPE